MTHPSPAALPGEFGLWVASKPGRAFTICPGSLEAGLLLRLNAYHYSVMQTVDPEGFEPSTFSMPLRRAPNCAMGPCVTDEHYRRIQPDLQGLCKNGLVHLSPADFGTILVQYSDNASFSFSQNKSNLLKTYSKLFGPSPRPDWECKL